MPATIALPKRSAGRLGPRFCGERHHHGAPITPRLLIASSQNGAAIPKPAMIAPPSAGPIARLMLKPTLLAATAGARSRLGTSCGTIACHAGAVSAPPVPIRNVNSSNVSGVTTSSQTNAANRAETAVVAISMAMRNRRLSMTSANAPAGSASRNIAESLPLERMTRSADPDLGLSSASRTPRCTSKFQHSRRRSRSTSR